MIGPRRSTQSSTSSLGTIGRSIRGQSYLFPGASATLQEVPTWWKKKMTCRPVDASAARKKIVHSSKSPLKRKHFSFPKAWGLMQQSMRPMSLYLEVVVLTEQFIGRRVDSCLRNVALSMVATQDRQRSPAAISFPPDASFSPIVRPVFYLRAKQT